MKVEVVMPKMGESINEGTIIKWHKSVGDNVKKDEIIYEISTDKVDTEIPSPADGKLVEIKIAEQETVDVDTVVAIIETDGDSAVEDFDSKSESVKQPSTTQVGGELIDIVMPKMGESVMEGTIIKWHKKIGDKIERDEIIYEISTDKVDTEVPSPVEGTLTEILVNEQETVEVDTVVARISSIGGIVKPKSEPVETMKPEPAAVVEQSIVKRDKVETNRFYSPLVLNIARKNNIPVEELEQITGTGLKGRVTKKDMLVHVESRTSSQKSRSETVYDKSKRVEVIPMDRIRQNIMTHMVKSRDTSVHVTGVVEVDMSVIYNFIKRKKDEYLKKENVKLTYMPFISFACVRALKEYPFLNASIDGINILKKKYINLGVAVAVEPNGLIVPNIKNADEKSLIGLARSINELGINARTKKLLPDDVVDGTFSITNYGVFGSIFGTPIINQPEVGILGVGTVAKKPVVMEINGQDTIGIKPMMYLALSHDHRLVDGMLGGQFLKHIKDTLENFDTNII